ncbi:MAG: glycerophosphodiester phosphodiesterase family protein [Reyranellaceae bacterium]
MKPLDLPPVIGHRGAAAYAPENTLASFREAKKRGASWVEFDVKLSADNRLVLMHDASLKRTAGLDALVATTSYADLRRLDAGSWFGPSFRDERVPDFEETIALLGELGLGANVEIKPCPGREEETAIAVVAALDRLWPSALPTPLLSSFKDASLAAAQQKAPHYPRFSLFDVIEGPWRERARAVGALGINTNGHKLRPESAQAIKAGGWMLGVYTINEGPKAKALRAMGADTVISDAPDLILAALAL